LRASVVERTWQVVRRCSRLLRGSPNAAPLPATAGWGGMSFSTAARSLWCMTRTCGVLLCELPSLRRVFQHGHGRQPVRCGAKALEFFCCESVTGGAHRCCCLPVSGARSLDALWVIQGCRGTSPPDPAPWFFSGSAAASRFNADSSTADAGFANSTFQYTLIFWRVSSPALHTKPAAASRKAPLPRLRGPGHGCADEDPSFGTLERGPKDTPNTSGPSNS
jgi:hypothetical protein